MDALATHLISAVNRSSNVATRSAGDELTQIVRDALRHIWSVDDWRWMAKTADLTISADATTAAVAADFRKIDSKWMNDNSEYGRWLRFTNNLREVVGLRSVFEDSERRRPQLACVARDTSNATSLAWLAQLVPTSDKAYTHTYVYLPECSLDLPNTHADFKTDSEEIVMPLFMHGIWKDRAFYRAKMQFTKDHEAQSRAKSEYTQNLSKAAKNQNETLTSEDMRTTDDYQDWDSLNTVALTPAGNPDIRLPG